MEEVEYLCQRVAILDRGRVIAQGPIDAVRGLAGDGVVLRIPLARGAGETVDAEALRRAVPVPVEVRAGELRFILPQGSAQVPAVLNALVALNVPLDGLKVESPNLETVFLSLTGKALRDHETEGVAP